MAVRPKTAPMKSMYPILLISLLTAVVCTFSCGCRPSKPIDFGEKIPGIPALDAQGLYGPADGLRSWAYEFCIPDRPGCRSDVLRIEPDLRIHSNAPGRAGCGDGLLLCIGETGPHWQETLTKLAALDWVEKIQACHFE